MRDGRRPEREADAADFAPKGRSSQAKYITALKVVNEARAAGRMEDDDAQEALALVGEKRTLTCADCRDRGCQNQKKQRRVADATIKAHKTAKFLNQPCGCGVYCGGVVFTERTIGEGWCLMCNTISAIKASREFWDDLARKGEARTTYDAKRNYGNRLDARRYVATLKVDTHCPGCDLKCTELNVEGFVHAHFADTAHLKHQGTRCQDAATSFRGLAVDWFLGSCSLALVAILL